MREARGPEWTEWLTERGIVALTGIDTRSLVLHLRDRRRDARGRRAGDATVEQVLARSASSRRWPAARSSPTSRRAEPYVCRERRATSTSPSSTTAEALDPPPARSRGRARDGLPARRRRRRRSPATTASCSRTAPATRRRSPTRSPSCASCSGACRCSASASATSCSALATGHETFKLPFGHRGANHPVLDRATGRVLVTTQNHGFAVAPRTTREATHVSLYDGTVEGLDFPELRARSMQFHPEAGPGPHDAWPLIEQLGRGGARCRVGHDLESICLIGSGPIVIGQASEFDYAGCQALKVLREDGYRTIVVNSNPATIMTDPGFADRTYLEPLDLEGVTDVLAPRAARRPAADDGRPDRAQPRARAGRGGRPRRARHRADRRAAST